jgi:hypothetical protein
MEFFGQVNWVAVVLGAVFSMLLGFLWYGPLFGKLWLRSIGKKQEELSSNAGMYVFAAYQLVLNAAEGLLGVVSLFADMTYEGGRSLVGQYLGLLGASAAAIAVTAGAGEFLGYALRFVSGWDADRTKRYWAITIFGYLF